MIEDKKTPKWCQRPPWCSCRICGRSIDAGEEYEVVKPKGARPTMYFHTVCVEKDNREMKEARGL